MSTELLRRGFEEIIPSEEFAERMDGGARIKFGADPTGSDLHLGHAVMFNKLRQFQDAGHTVVFIVGDFTARIGDPSGRDETRPPLSQEQVESNAETFKSQAFSILDEDRTEVRYNSNWLEDLGTDGLLELTSSMTVARMLERDDFSKRYQENNSIRIHEFIYPLLQGWDSVEVEADFELGGTDQKFNLLMGRRLQKQQDQSPQLIGTLPLLVGTDGTKKMGKSHDNHIPLDSKPRQMFGQLMSVPDDLIENYITLLTDKPTDYLDDMGSGKTAKKQKKRMAYAVTARFKGEDKAKEAREHFERTIERGQDPEDREMQTVRVSGDEIWIVDLLDESGMVESRGEAKRLLKQGGVYLDGDRLEGFDHDIPLDGEHTLKVGKHRFRRVVPE